MKSLRVLKRPLLYVLGQGRPKIVFVFVFEVDSVRQKRSRE